MMKTFSSHRFAAIATLGLALAPVPGAHASAAQDDASAKGILLSRARTLEQRGRLDLAQQDWTQVLTVDPTNAEALGGLVRSARASGHLAEANSYLARLRTAHPGDPELARLDAASKQHDASTELAEAAKLVQAGDPRAAMVLYRRVYGMNPPAGQPALVYFTTEAATEEGRPHAIAGLRAMADRYPTDTRYQIALGRVLLTNARTRAEGRTILEQYPQDAEAVAALGASSGAATQIAGTPTPAGSTSSGIAGAHAPGRTPPALNAERPASGVVAAASPSSGTSTASADSLPPPSSTRLTRPVGTTLTSAPQGTAPGHHLSYAVEEQAAFTALNEHRMAEAEQRFNQILAKDPRDSRALAGLGYLRVTSGDLKAAVSYFEQAQENGDRSLALTRAMVNADFELALQQAAAQRARGDLGGAEARYRSALRERPSDPEAMDGLAETLLQQGRAADAVDVFHRLTEIRPMSPEAWRGLVVAEVDSGKSSAAIATDAQVPSGVKGPLQQDPIYQHTLAQARAGQPAQMARVETPPPPPAPLRVPPSVVAVPVAPRPTPVPPPPAAAPVTPRPVAVAPPSTTSTPAAKPPAPTVSPAPVPAPATAAASTHAPSPNHEGESRESVTRKNPRTRTPRATPTPPQPAPPVVAAAPPPPPAVPVNTVIADERMEQADTALMRGQNVEASALFQDVLARAPQRPEAWRGLVLSLQRGGREQEAAATLQRIPASARTALERDATFQNAAGAVYLASNQPVEALHSLARAQEIFASQRLAPPLDLVLQTARLLSARADDENLYRELMYLGERRDLNDAQRAQVQMIWTQWAVRRARALAVDGEDRRAVILLNAAAVAFAGNGEVLRAVANGYAGVGRPKEAVALYKTQDVANAPAPVIEAAVSAATAAHDFKAAENWIRFGLSRFAQDPQMLNSAAELEQARGHEKRAVELSQQAKAIAPAQDPGQVLTAELRQAKAGAGWSERREAAGQLSVLLAPSDPAVVAAGTQTGRPYLPATAGVAAPANSSALPSDAPVLAGYDEPSL